MEEGKIDNTLKHAFDLSERVAVITGGAGLLGEKHAEAIAAAGGIPVLVDINGPGAESKAHAISERFGAVSSALKVDITQPDHVRGLLEKVLKQYGRVDILINNAANNPKVEDNSGTGWSRLENFPLGQWERDLSVGLTGAFLCSSILGTQMAKCGKGVIVNVASDLAVIAPDQRIYREPGQDESDQTVKPVTYSVVKTGLIGLTRYLATYWAHAGVRVNAISPGGVYTNQPEGFVQRLTNLIPMGRMAHQDEYKAALLFLCSDGSSYMTGQNLVIDGGRSCW